MNRSQPTVVIIRRLRRRWLSRISRTFLLEMSLLPCAQYKVLWFRMRLYQSYLLVQLLHLMSSLAIRSQGQCSQSCKRTLNYSGAQHVYYGARLFISSNCKSGRAMLTPDTRRALRFCTVEQHMRVPSISLYRSAVLQRSNGNRYEYVEGEGRSWPNTT